jgi:predicted AAA+ superfamily ATPase
MCDRGKPRENEWCSDMICGCKEVRDTRHARESLISANERPKRNERCLPEKCEKKASVAGSHYRLGTQNVGRANRRSGKLALFLFGSRNILPGVAEKRGEKTEKEQTGKRAKTRQ